MCRSNWVEASTRGPAFNTTVPSRKFELGDIVTVGYSRDVYVYLKNNFIIRVPADTTIDPPEAYAIDENIKELSVTCKYRISIGLGILIRNTDDFTKFATRAVMDRVQYATASDITEHNANARKDYPVFLGDWIFKIRKGG
jgi:hypothetical protein